jgi:hypothetical protein
MFVSTMQETALYTSGADFPIENFDVAGALCSQFGFTSPGLQLHILG